MVSNSSIYDHAVVSACCVTPLYFSADGLYFMLRDTIYLPGSTVLITDIGGQGGTDPDQPGGTLVCVTTIGVGSGGARGRLAPPSFKLGGHRPPNFTHCLHNELYCSIVDRIACRHCSSRKSHFCCLKKCRPPPSQNIFLHLW